MPLVVLCGQPCSGKSTVARELQALCQAAGASVDIVDEASLHLDKNVAYSSKWALSHGFLPGTCAQFHTS